MRAFIRGLALQLLLLAAGACHSWAQSAPVVAGPLVIEKQGSFFLGGREEEATPPGPATGIGSPGTITVDQVYVRYQTPPGASGRPNIVLVHGCCLTGKSWETTPDGRMGWDEYFVRRGFSTYVVDQAWRGRSAMDPSAIYAVAGARQPITTLPPVFTMSHQSAWVLFRFGPQYGQAFAGLKFPVGSASELWKQMVPDWSFGLPSPNPTAPVLSALAKRVGPAILIGHSQSGIYPFQAVAADKHNVVGVIAIEPAACPSPSADMTPYKDVPILVMFGDNIAASPVWTSILKACRDYGAALRAAGGRAEIIVLPEVGVTGNSHMLMQDLNNLQIADLLIGWIDRIAARRP